MSVTLNPMATTNAAGTFGDTTDGYVAGSLWPNAAARQFIRGGMIAHATAATTYIYGGVGITALLPSLVGQSVENNTSPILQLATAIANLTGFAVWDQSFSGIQTPSSPASLFSADQGIDFVDFGSGSSIKLPLTNAAALALANAQENTQLSWDYTNQCVIAYAGGGANAGAIPGTGPGGVAKIIDVNVGNSWVVITHTNYAMFGAADPGVGQATWLESGSVVVLQI